MLTSTLYLMLQDLTHTSPALSLYLAEKHVTLVVGSLKNKFIIKGCLNSAMFRIHNKNSTAFIARLSMNKIIVIKQNSSRSLHYTPMHVCMDICMYSLTCLFAMSSIFKNQYFLYKYTMTNCMYIQSGVCECMCKVC